MKRAFTLVELLLVIVIISILGVLAVNAYVYARYKGMLSLQTDKIVELMRTQQKAVERGESRGKPLCRGMRFAGGEKYSVIMAEYKPEIGCGPFSVVEDYVLLPPLNIVSLQLGNTAPQVFDVFFVPPEANMKFTPAPQIVSSGASILLQFGNRNEDEWRKKINFDPVSSRVTINTP